MAVLTNAELKKIKVGQHWLTRDGMGVEITGVIDDRQAEYPIVGVFKDTEVFSGEHIWTDKGEYLITDRDGRDFVSLLDNGFDKPGFVEPLSPTVAMDVHATAEQIAALAAMAIVGYESLAGVLREAYTQAAVGKGHERHSNGEPFDRQVMADMAHRFGVGALLGQAFKKSEESQRLGDERGIMELLGAINYLAGAVIAIRRQRVAEGLA